MKHSRKLIAAALIAGTLTGFALSAQAQTTISSDATYDPATQQNASWVVTNGASLTFNDVATKATEAVSIVLGDSAVSGDTGNLVFNMTTVPSTVTHGANYSLSASKPVSISGSGTITLQGGGDLAMISAEGGAVMIALTEGSQININKGHWVDGGWSTQNWSNNKADLNIASEAYLDMWDGSAIYVNKLTGSGVVNTAKVGIRGPLYVGVADGSSLFDGTFTGYTTLVKTGSGTLTLTKASSNTGTTASYSSDAATIALLANSLVISKGTVKLTDSGTPGLGTVQIDANGTLEIANSYAFSQKITGTGTINKNSTAEPVITDALATNLAEFAGTIKVSSGIFYVRTNNLSDKLTLGLDGGLIRNKEESYSLNSNLVINSASGGLRSGWEKQSLTVNGKISDGSANTLNIVADSNSGDKASWIILTNPNNNYTNTSNNGYLRVTQTGALGTGTVTVASSGVLDLTTTTLAASRLANNGTVTSSSTTTPGTITLTGSLPGGTITGNIAFQLASTTNIGTESATRTGGTLIQNMGNNCVSYAAGLGSGDITLDNGLIMNNNLTLGVYQNVVVTSNGGSIRAGWAINKCSLGVTGNISGAGKLTFNSGEGNPAPIYLAGNNTYTGGTSFGSTGGTNRMYIDTNSAFGTGQVDINGKTVVLAFNTGGAWGRTLYNGSFNTTDSVSIAEYKTNMDDTANTNSKSSWNDSNGENPNNKTFGYSTVIQSKSTTTLEFGKHFDDSVAIFVTNLNTGEKTTVMNKAGDWTVKTYADFTFEAGVPYQVDVRLGQGSGGVGVSVRHDGTDPNLDGLNDDPNDLVGVGVRVKDSGGKFVRLSVAANGDWAFSDGSIKTIGQNKVLSNDLKIGGSTLTLENTGIGNATVSGKISGTGTLAFTNSSLLDSDLNGLSIFNGSPDSAADTFNVTVGPNVRFSGNGTIGGSLSLDDSAILVIDESMNLGVLKINSSLDASGATIDVLLDGSDPNFVLKAGSIDLTDAQINVSYSGEPSLLDEFVTFTVLDSDSITGWDSAAISVDPGTAGIGLVASWAENGNVYVQLGNGNSVPEPASWILLLSALTGILIYRRRK